MNFNAEEIRQAIYEHCVETGIDFDIFIGIYRCQIDHPEVFDIFFEIPFNFLCEPAKKKRLETLIEALTT